MLVLTLSTFLQRYRRLPGLLLTTIPSLIIVVKKGLCLLGRPVKGGRIDCYEKFDMTGTLSYQKIQFFEVNYAQWFGFRHVTRSLMFDGYRWVNTKFTMFHHGVLIVPSPGQFLYMEDRHDRHVFFPHVR